MPDNDVPPGSAPQADPKPQNRYRLVSVLAVGLIATATVVYRVAEGWTWVDSFYFSMIAVTTVGFGDLTPTSNLAKLFTVAYVLAGMSLIAAVVDERLRRHHRALTWLALHTERHRRVDERGDQGGSGDNS